MKYLVTLAAAAAVAIVVAGCTPDPPPPPPAYIGTWVNPANNGHGLSGPPAKIVWTADSMVFYDNVTDTTPLNTGGSFALKDSWDSGSDHYFKGIGVWGAPPPITVYLLIFVSNNHNTLEATGSTTDYPASLAGRPDSIFTRR
jgi:hypothetical protein